MGMMVDELQKYINALRKCAKEHENDRTFTGHIIVSDLCRDTANLLEELEQEPGWIPVSERLPKIKNCRDNYLVTLKSGGVHIGMFIECNGKHWWTHYDDVIAWMPLPKPYREVENGNDD